MWVEFIALPSLFIVISTHFLCNELTIIVSGVRFKPLGLADLVDLRNEDAI